MLTKVGEQNGAHELFMNTYVVVGQQYYFNNHDKDNENNYLLHIEISRKSKENAQQELEESIDIIQYA